MDQIPPSNLGDLDAPASPDLPQVKTLSLTPDQLTALGIGDCAPGDTYNIQLKYSGDDAASGAPGPDGTAPQDADAPKNFDVVSSTTETPDEGDTDPDAPTDQLGDNAPDDASSPEEKILGFKRSPKPPKTGLPDTKKMRNW